MFAILVFGMRQEYQTGPPDLILLLSQIRVGRECTDPKDRIYAMLGMAGDAERLGIVINCEKSYLCSQLYCEATRAIIGSGDVDLLAFARRSKDIESSGPEDDADSTDLPSWVPDWRKEVMEPFGLFPWHTPYKAAGDAKEGIVVEHHELDDAPHQYLRLKGYEIDSIKSLKSPCHAGRSTTSEDHQENWKYLQEIQALCQESDQIGGEIYTPAHVRKIALAAVPIASMNGLGFFHAAPIEQMVSGWLAVAKAIEEWAAGRPWPDKPIELQYYYNGMARQSSRRPFITSKGHVGLAPGHTQEGDIVVIFRGGKFPYTLRRSENGNYVLVGETYVYGLMSGEVTNLDLKLEDFCLQ
jgi:hypothetical protein